MCRVLVSSSVGAAYIYIHQHHCLYPLPWDSTTTWLLAAVGIDFCYYWVHRAAHGTTHRRPRHDDCLNLLYLTMSEIHVLWAAHQVHHSAEDYNLTTALRQSAFQTFGSWVSSLFINHHLENNDLTCCHTRQPFYLPLALVVPPSHAVVHKELNLLYQVRVMLPSLA